MLNAQKSLRGVEIPSEETWKEKSFQFVFKHHHYLPVSLNSSSSLSSFSSSRHLLPSFLSLNWKLIVKRVVKVKCDYYWVLLWNERTPCHIHMPRSLFFVCLVIISIYFSTFFYWIFYLLIKDLYLNRWNSAVYICRAHITCRSTS